MDVKKALERMSNDRMMSGGYLFTEIRFVGPNSITRRELRNIKTRKSFEIGTMADVTKAARTQNVGLCCTVPYRALMALLR